MTTEIKINRKLIEEISKIPITLRNGPFGRCLGKFGDPIARRAVVLGTSSRATRSRTRRIHNGTISGGWSKRYKDDPRWSGIDSRNHFGRKVGKQGVWVIVGAIHPKGNKQQFVHPSKNGDSYTRYHWGKPGQLISYEKNGKNVSYIRQSKGSTSVARFPKEQRAVVQAFRREEKTAEERFLIQLQKELRELRLG